MEAEFHQYNKVKRYLEKLGYPSSTVLYEYRTTNSGFFDIVVKTNEGILIVIEVKDKIPINLDNKEEIGFHPITRQLQKNAHDLKAEYYIVSDGSRHIWLTTGINGRPIIINEIPYKTLGGTELSESNFLKEILDHTSEYLRSYSITGDLLYDISIVFYLKLANELKINRYLNIYDFVNTEIKEAKLKKGYSTEKIIEETLFRLDSISFINNKESVLLFISELFQKNRREWIIPRWVADFMVKILQCNGSHQVLDVITRYGMLMSAGFLNGLTNITSYYTNPHEIYWIKIQQLLLLGHEGEAHYQPEIANGQINKEQFPKAEGILLAPPFNLKLEADQNSYLMSIGIKDSTSIFIEMGLQALSDNGRLVAIVPDGFLLSSAYKKARQYFKSQSNIEAIISLPPDTFHPYASVKTSIISITRKKHNNDKSCFLAALENFSKEISINISKSNDATKIIKNLNAFRTNKSFTHSKLGILENELDVENFHFTKYWFQSHYDNNDNLQDGFVPVPLKELLEKIIRGSQLISDEGNIPYIGPAAIRGMQIIEEELSYTSSERLPKSVNIVNENDVIINAIGSHRGSATVVPSSLEGTPINRHVILLQANTDMIIPGYLATVLNSKYVQDQFFDKSTGTVIPALNTRSFEEIYIPVPSLSKQIEIYNDYLVLINKLNEAENTASKLKSQIRIKLNILGKEDYKS